MFMSRDGRRPLETALLKIQQLPHFANKKGIRQFMGFINWYREYFRGVAQTAEPLNRLTNGRKVEMVL